MKCRFLTLLLLLLVGFSYSYSENLVLNGCSYMGRVDDSSREVWRFSYPGVSIKMRFKGSEKVSVLMADSLNLMQGQSNWFYLFLDGKLIRKFQTTAEMKEIPLVDNLSKTEHCIEIIKLTESNIGVALFKGFIVDEQTKVLKSEYSSSLKMEFIGNSITVGYGNEVSSDPPKSTFESVNENNYHAWGAIVARAFSANYHCTAYSGIGLQYNFSGDTMNVMPKVYDRIIPDDVHSKWNHKRYIPHVVVINLGTNDFSAEANSVVKIDSVSFVNRYSSFLKVLRDYYPLASIVCVVGPMMSDSYPSGLFHWSKIQRYVKAAMIDRKSKGDSNLYYFMHSPQNAPYGEHYHPSKETHQRMADEFIAFFKSIVNQP